MDKKQEISMKTISLLLTLGLIMTSCSVFKGKRRMDMSPFAENTQTFFSEAIKIERPFPHKKLRSYTSIPEVQKLQELAPPVLNALRGIVFYSNQVVAINNSKLSQKDKCRMLANYLNEVMEKALSEKQSDTLQVDLSRARVILDNIRNAPTYMDGLAASEQIINGVVAAILDRIDEIQNQIPLIIAGFNREIEKDFARSAENYDRLLVLQEQLILSVTRLYKARIGDTDELVKLLAENASLRYFIPSVDRANHDNLIKVEVFLLGQVNEVENMIKQLDDIRADYVAKKEEVVSWRNEIDNKILIARTSLNIWARAHKNLGTGVPVPPMIDVTGIASNLAGNAAKSVIP
jgi:hypothetical protein